MDNEITHNVPPTPPRTEGRKKIRIARIEDTRSRQVTFLKRKNGLLKKAMELGILCDCEVAVIIFNTSNGKLFEYSSVETEKVLQRYATYSGPSERRKKDSFFDLSKSKGTSNIPLNEPTLAQTAMNAAAAAARRPRPTYKFSEAQDVTQEYSNTGRKLSSGETPVGPHPALRAAIPSTSLPSGYEEPTKRQKMSHDAPTPASGMPSSGVVPPIQLPDLVSGRPSFMPFTPRFSSNLALPTITPNTASRHISAAFGLPEQTPSMSGLTPAPNYNRTPFNTSQQVQEPEVNDTTNHHHQAHQSFQASMEALGKPTGQDFSAPARTQHQLATDDNATKSEDASHGEVQVKQNQIPQPAESSDTNQEYSTERNTQCRPTARVKPNLRVQIPDPNREDIATVTPSGLHSATTPSSGDENGTATLQIHRLNAAITSPAGNGGWSGWNSIGNGDRDGPVPLTPFLNMDPFTSSSDVGNGHISLPSPTDAGLIPLTPRGFGLDSLLSARPSTRSQETGKRPFDSSYEQNRSVDPRRPYG